MQLKFKREKDKLLWLDMLYRENPAYSPREPVVS